MAEVTLLGSGVNLATTASILQGAGIVAERGDEAVEAAGNTPVFLGDLPNCYTVARRLVEAGRDVIVCNPLLLTPVQVQSLYLARKPRQALFVWSDRLHHSANRMIAGLVQTGDQDWAPRLLRSTTFSQERPSGALLAWRTVEAIALVTQLAGSEAGSAGAIEAPGDTGGREDFISLNLHFNHIVATVQVGLGEAAEARRTMIATASRKTYINELDSTVPLRILDGERVASSTSSRWVACPSPSATDLARLQVVDFLEAVQDRATAARDAAVWLPALAVWRTAQASLARAGAPQPVLAPVADPAPATAAPLATKPFLRLVGS